MERQLLMLPGPMQVPESVARAGSRPLFFHRSPRFIEFQDRLRRRIQPLFGTSSARVVFLSACGTGAMESALVNVTSPGEEVIVMVGGAFAGRWVEIGRAFGLAVHPVEVDWPTGATGQDVAAAMDRFPAARVVCVTWSESSTGVLIDLESIGTAVRERGGLLLADAVSGLAVSPLDIDRWHADVVVSGSQKGLMMPPGLGVVALSDRAFEWSSSAASPRFTWDWRPYFESVPVTPPLSLMHQLDAALDIIEGMGLPAFYARRHEVAETIRRLVTGAGLELYARRPGDGITAVVAPGTMDIARFRKRLEDDYGIVIGGGQGRTAGEVFRIGHVGAVDDDELAYFSRSFIEAVGPEL